MRPILGRAPAGPAVAGGMLLAVPAIGFALLRANPSWDVRLGSGTSHFLIVSVVAALALALAVAVLQAARALPDIRSFFLAAGFLVMSGLFLAHGAGTGPFFHERTGTLATMSSAHATGLFSGYTEAGNVDEAGGVGAMPAVPGGSPAPETAGLSRTALARGQVVGLSARLSLTLSALCFALAVVELPHRFAVFLSRWRAWLTAMLGGALTVYLLIALFAPERAAGVALALQRMSWPIAVATWATLAFAGWRFVQAYRLAMLPLQGAMALGMGLLAEAQWFMIRAPLWHFSWWGYHLAMLAGFLAPVLALLRQYRTAGDLGAVVEGLFLRDQLRGLRRGDPGALTALAAAVAAKDSETGAHTERVGELAVGIGRKVGVPPERLELLRWAGRLHDLGKIGVPNSILRKPGRLTDAEMAVMRLHSPRGGHIALRSQVLAEVAPIIRAHHERLNGSGYPDGLRGDAIPLEARVIAVADVWDALTCDRPYRPAMSFDEAAAVIRRESGELLDPRCVDALFAILAERGQEAA